jgi:hypothetical protein
MTKLEELKAAAVSAWEAACDASKAVAESDYDAAYDAWVAYIAYQAELELKKSKELTK